MENVINEIDLKDGTKVRVYPDDHMDAADSPLDWNTEDYRFYANDSDRYYIKTFPIASLSEDLKGKKNWYGIKTNMVIEDSCPGVWYTDEIKKRSEIKVDKVIEDLPDAFYTKGLDGLLMIKAKDIQEARSMADGMAKNMTDFLSGDVFVVEHYKEIECESCGHVEEESIDCVGGCYFNDVNDDVEIVENMGLDKELID